MNNLTDKLAVLNDPNNDVAFLYHKIIGDGHCFINCYLESLLPIYRNIMDRNLKTSIARKVRLDFANFLLSPSKKSDKEISTRLNFINPNIMCILIKSNDVNKNSIDHLEIIKDFHNKNKHVEKYENQIYLFIESLNLIDVETNLKLTYDRIKYIYETDHRINVSKAEYISSKGNSPFNPEIFGVGKIPINIGFYEIAENIGTGYDEFIKSINILIHPTEFLTHFESTLFASYIDVNSIIFPIGNYYRDYYKLNEKIDDVPDIFMVNINNIHWNLISLYISGNEGFLLNNISDEIKTLIFRNLCILHEGGKL